MTFYQELQLNQSGSKEYVASFKDPKEKLKHMGIYLFKILQKIAFVPYLLPCSAYYLALKTVLQDLLYC